MGSRVGRHNLQAEYVYGNTKPSVDDRLGYVLSDSSRFWTLGARYAYQGAQDEIQVFYNYVYADLRLFGLIREEYKDYGVDEKRFAYLPIGLDVYVAGLNGKREASPAFDFLYRLLYLQVNLVLPWESRRFYETLAPNKAIDNAALQMLSYSVFQRSFRMFGDIDATLVDAGIGLAHETSLGNWSLNPKIFLDVFSATLETSIYMRKETSGIFYFNHVTDLNEQKMSIYGLALSGGFRLNSPKRMFFAEFGVAQLIPLNFEQKKKNSFRLENYASQEEDPFLIQPDIQDESVTNERNEFSFTKEIHNLSELAFKNGFAVTVALGFMF